MRELDLHFNVSVAEVLVAGPRFVFEAEHWKCPLWSDRLTAP